METVDSKKKKLAFQEVMVRAIVSQKKDLDVPVDHALMSLIAELQMPNTEAIQFGNTVFISHYSPESPMCAMYALNVDTAKNYINNGEMYVRHLIKNGITGFVTTYKTESFGIPFKQIEKNRLGIVETGKTQGGRFMTVVKLYQKKKQEEQTNV